MNKFVSNIHNKEPRKDIASYEEIQDSINPYQQERNTSDGGEFLDDAIRMQDQLSGDTDEPTDEISLYVSQPFNEPDEK